MEVLLPILKYFVKRNTRGINKHIRTAAVSYIKAKAQQQRQVTTMKLHVPRTAVGKKFAYITTRTLESWWKSALRSFTKRTFLWIHS
jgi:uncharacterized PurR-regulated membrane protein YhhQ (DUF165 family)